MLTFSSNLRHLHQHQGTFRVQKVIGQVNTNSLYLIFVSGVAGSVWLSVTHRHQQMFGLLLSDPLYCNHLQITVLGAFCFLTPTHLH